MRGLMFLLCSLSAAASAADPHAAARTIIAAQCSSCHVVPGVSGAVGNVGPSLRGIARQRMIAGRLPNNPDNMVRWLMHPQRIDPGNAMPEMGLTDDPARRIAAYLATLDDK
jgi:cytochrome c2